MLREGDGLVQAVDGLGMLPSPGAGESVCRPGSGAGVFLTMTDPPACSLTCGAPPALC
jgi:hypothetical protein